MSFQIALSQDSNKFEAPMVPLLNGNQEMMMNLISEPAEKVVGEMREYLRAVQWHGLPIEPMLRANLERQFRADLSTIRIHTGVHTDRVTARLGTLAFAHGEQLHLSSFCQRCGGVAREWLLAHEVAHVLQQRGGMVETLRVPRRTQDTLEGEAWHAAFEVLAKRECVIVPRPDSPDIQCLPSVIVVALVCLAAGIGIGAHIGETEERRKRVRSDPNPHFHEGAWGWIPFAGSWDQVFNARSDLDRLAGTVFLMLDASLAGAVIKGAIVGFRGLAKIGLREVLAGGGAAIQRDAYGKALAEGVQFSSREMIADQALKMSRSGPVVMVGAHGWGNHSVSYVLSNGKIWKIHGGPFKLFVRETYEPLSRELLLKSAGKMNTASLYRVSEPVAQQALEWWTREINKGTFNSFLRAEGCAGSQVLLMEQLGLHIPGTAGFSRLAPLFPLFMEGARFGGPGIHVITNPLWKSGFRVTTAAVPQAFFWLGPRSVTAAAAQKGIMPLHEFFSMSESDPGTGLLAEQLSPPLFSSDLGMPEQMLAPMGEIMIEIPSEFSQSLRTQSTVAGGSGKKGDFLSLPVEVSSTAELIYRGLNRENPKSAYQIARETGLSMAEVGRAINELERNLLIIPHRLGPFAKDEAGQTGYIRAR